MSTEVGRYDARVNRKGAHSPFASAPVQPYTEQDIGCLRFTVGLPLVILPLMIVGITKVEIAKLVPCGAEINYPARRTLHQCRRQQPSKQKVAQMVGPKLHFKTLRGTQQRAGHYTRVIDQQMYLGMVEKYIGGGVAHTIQVRQVHALRMQLCPRLPLLNLLHGCLQFLLVARDHHHSRPRCSQYPTGLHPKPRGGTRNDS